MLQQWTNQSPWPHGNDIIMRQKTNTQMYKGHLMPRDKCSEKNKAKGRLEAWMRWASKPVH